MIEHFLVVASSQFQQIVRVAHFQEVIAIPGTANKLVDLVVAQSRRSKVERCLTSCEVCEWEVMGGIRLVIHHNSGGSKHVRVVMLWLVQAEDVMVVMSLMKHDTRIIEVKQIITISLQEIELILRVRPFENMVIIIESNILRVAVFQIRSQGDSCLLPD